MGLALFFDFVRVKLREMKITTHTILSVALVIFSLWAYAQAAVDSTQSRQSSQFIMCKNQKNVRTIRVEHDKGEDQCVTFYTKAGVDREVGRGQSMVGCLKIIDNIKTNLEKANWKCKGHDKVSMTSTKGMAN